MFTENKDNRIKTEKKPISNTMVLIVEDDPASYYLLKELLSNTFDEIHLERTGRGAIDFFKRNQDKTDIIIMDIVLPEMDGITATQIIRKFNSTIPIIAISGDVTRRNQKLSLEAGCNHFLHKPLDIHNFIRTLKSSLPVKV
jgi:CheY-like chemotaxis protein